MDNKELGNLTLREIRAMLATGDIVLQDLDTATVEKLMDREIDLLCIDEGDTGFISECADILSERETDIMSHEDFMEVVNKTLAEHTMSARKRFSLKRALIIAATVATLLVGGTMVASALGFDLWGYISETVRQPNGTEKESNGFTIYNGGQTKKYTTLKVAVEKENLNIMYPEALPDGVSIEKIQIADSTIGDKKILILTKNDAIIITVDTNVAPADNDFVGDDIHQSGVITYKLFEGTPENKYGAYFNVDNCSYIIQAKEYNDLIFVIDNMKER